MINHLSACIDSDIEDSVKANPGGNTTGGGGAMAGGAFGSSAKIGYTSAAGFVGLGASASYGGAFNNSIIPERVGSTTPNDLSVSNMNLIFR